MREHVGVPDLLKYARVERERRFLIAALPTEAARTIRIEDHDIDGSRMRLRQMTNPDGSIVRKLGHKVRLTEGPADVACTWLYLTEGDWQLLRQHPSRTLEKTRHLIHRDGYVVAVDELNDGTLVAEIDDGEGAPKPIPGSLDVIRDVSDDEAWTGAALAR